MRSVRVFDNDVLADVAVATLEAVRVHLLELEESLTSEELKIAMLIITQDLSEVLNDEATIIPQADGRRICAQCGEEHDDEDDDDYTVLNHDENAPDDQGPMTVDQTLFR